MKDSYYDWPKSMALKNDSELIEIFKDRNQISEEKRKAVENEMVSRGILHKEGVKKIKKIDSEILFSAAKLYNKGVSFSEIESKLESLGLNEINSKKVVNELHKWVKKEKRIQWIFISIGSILTAVCLFLAATDKLKLGFAPWFVIGGFLAVGFATFSPKKFKKADIYEIIDKKV